MEGLATNAPVKQTLLLVDIDGTLLRVHQHVTRHMWSETWSAVVGGELPWQRLDTAAGKTDLQILAQLLSDVTAARALAPDFFNELANRAEHAITRDAIEICPGATDFLDTARRLGAVSVILSGNDARIGWHKLCVAGLDGYFITGFFGGDAYDRSELPPRALRWAFNQGYFSYGISAIVVGDTPNDIACARHHNLRCIAVASGPYTFDELVVHQPTACFRHLGHAALSLHRFVPTHTMARLPIIAIDGPAGSGKTTTARLLAERLGFTYIDTGAMYRALTLAALEQGVPMNDEALASLLERSNIELRSTPEGQRTFLDGHDVTERIRMPDVTTHVSQVSSFPSVRAAMVRIQQQLGARGGVVMDGRDIGTAVFPDADVKIYMTADLATRAERRLEELRATDPALSLHDVVSQLDERDRRDSSRELNPLRRADDAIVIDTTNMSIEEQVECIARYVRERIVESSPSLP